MVLGLTSKFQQESLKDYFNPHEKLTDHAGEMGKKLWPRDMLLRPAVLHWKAVRNFKMAEKIYNNVFEVIEGLTNKNDEA